MGFVTNVATSEAIDAEIRTVYCFRMLSIITKN